MATTAPLLAPILLTTSSLRSPITSALTSASSSTVLPAAITGAALAAAPVVSRAASGSYILYRLARVYVKNTRITPVAGYLAYKGSGYADQGGLAGMTISDFVAVWRPYNTGDGRGWPGRGDAGKGVGKVQGRGGGKKEVEGKGGGTKSETARVLADQQGRDARPARQSVKFGKRRRHFCQQQDCERAAL